MEHSYGSSGYGGGEERQEGYGGTGYGGSSGYAPSYGGTETLGVENLNISGGRYRGDDGDGERHGRRHRKHDGDDD